MNEYIKVEEIANDYFKKFKKSDDEYLKSYLKKNNLFESYFDSIKEDLNKDIKIIEGINKSLNLFLKRQKIECFAFEEITYEKFKIKVNNEISLYVYKKIPHIILEIDNIDGCMFFLPNNNENKKVELYILNQRVNQQKKTITDYVNNEDFLPKELKKNMKSLFIDFLSFYEVIKYEFLKNENIDEILKTILNKDILKFEKEDFEIIKLTNDIDIKDTIIKIKEANKTNIVNNKVK